MLPKRCGAIWCNDSYMRSKDCWSDYELDRSRLFTQPNVSRNALSFTAVFFLSFFFPWHRSQHLGRGRPSNVFWTFGRRWSFINWPRDLAHTSFNFHRGRGQKVRNLASFSTSLDFEPRAFENTADNLNAKQACNAAMIALCSFQVWWSSVYAPLRTVEGIGPRWKIWRRKCAKSSITLPRILCKGFGHMTPEVLQKPKVKGSKVKVTAWRNKS